MPASLPKLRTLHYLLQKRAESNRVVAHCLDLDLVVSAPDLAEAEKRLDTVVVFYVESALAVGNWDALTTSAPDHYWSQFSNATRIEPHRQKLTFKVPEVVPMESYQSQISVLAAMSAAA